jgi:hypothetical protein
LEKILIHSGKAPIKRLNNSPSLSDFSITAVITINPLLIMKCNCSYVTSSYWFYLWDQLHRPHKISCPRNSLSDMEENCLGSWAFHSTGCSSQILPLFLIKYGLQCLEIVYLLCCLNLKFNCQPEPRIIFQVWSTSMQKRKLSLPSLSVLYFT